jgi:anaerobic selenocysteine-containing dehydrogenase
MVWGHNPAVTVPDSQRVREGLMREDLFLVVHELVMTETAKLADVVLPATALPEHTEIFRSYGHRVLQLSRRATSPPDEQRSNVDTFRALAQRMDLPRDLWDVTEEGLVDELLEANVARFEEDQLERLRAGEPVKLGTRLFPDQGTPGGRIELASRAAAKAGQPAVATYVPDDGSGDAGRFWLVSAPSVATHNSTYMHSKRHSARDGAPCCWMHPEDASELKLAEGESVRLTNDQGALTLPLALSQDQPRGILRIDGFPDPAQMPEGLSCNALTSPEVSDLGAGNVQYSTRVDIAPA